MENRPLYSAEISEIIGTPPRWMMRVGSGLLLLALVAGVALASVVEVPEQHHAAVRISGITAPYYLRQSAGGLRLLVASGQPVQQGQRLAGSLQDSSLAIRAPFRGTFYAEVPGQTANDTLGVLVPAATAYRFTGRVAPEQLRELRSHGRQQLQVALDEQADSHLLLHGQLHYINPVVRNGQVTYVGRLDSASNAQVARQFAGLNSLEGTLLVSSTHKPVLQRLFQ
ncbi:hypothetical protein [Hymenobacter metallilatus]|uniref:HlyD family efflux transporter periplasmic adaptor subunit n=1 Tax=Hymenobacter metallilatus TaxID=2493666 RepID=A0A3R9M5C8_9BACT|nr:hypothetical protein [Hymenobacter metallilatus]RSK37524.1 hypothetical protein EI290_02425 [Hymenobacter metallilatus]